MMSQNRAAARDELLAADHYHDTDTLSELLSANTELTKQIHDLTVQIHDLTASLAAAVRAGPSTSA